MRWGLLGILLRRDGSRSSLLPLRMLAGPLQHLLASILDAWRMRAASKLCTRKGVRCGPLCTWLLLVSSYLREREKMLLRSILGGGGWNGFLLGKCKEEDVPYWPRCLLWYGWLPLLAPRGVDRPGQLPSLILPTLDWSLLVLVLPCTLSPGF